MYGWLILFSALIVILDQVSKFLVAANIGLHEVVPVADGLFHLTYLKNTGMAFSLLQGGRWLFLILTLVVLALMVMAVKKKWVDHPLGLWAMAAIAGGAVGNLIDRVRMGYVVDMIEVEFISFPVFNVADCFVVCGAIVFAVYVLFFDKKEPSHGRNS